MTEPTTADHFASADRLIATARAAWEAEKRELEQKIFERDAQIALQEKAFDVATKARDAAFTTTAKLLTQFGIVSQVFEDAKKTAIEAGLYTQTPPSGEIEEKIVPQGRD